MFDLIEQDKFIVPQTRYAFGTCSPVRMNVWLNNDVSRKVWSSNGYPLLLSEEAVDKIKQLYNGQPLRVMFVRRTGLCDTPKMLCTFCRSTITCKTPCPLPGHSTPAEYQEIWFANRNSEGTCTNPCWGGCFNWLTCEAFQIWSRCFPPTVEIDAEKDVFMITDRHTRVSYADVSIIPADVKALLPDIDLKQILKQIEMVIPFPIPISHIVTVAVHIHQALQTLAAHIPPELIEAVKEAAKEMKEAVSDAKDDIKQAVQDAVQDQAEDAKSPRKSLPGAMNFDNASGDNPLAEMPPDKQLQYALYAALVDPNPNSVRAKTYGLSGPFLPGGMIPPSTDSQTLSVGPIAEKIKALGPPKMQMN